MSEFFKKLVCVNLLLSLSITSLPTITAASASEVESPATLSEFLADNENIEKRLDTFLAVCGEEGTEEYAPTPDYSCALEADALAPILEELEKQNAQTVAGECNDREGVLSRETISILKEDLSGELQCRKEDAELYETTCSKEFGCNLLRSGISAAQALPGMIEEKVTGFLKAKAESMNAGASCLDESRSSCLTEVWTTFYANIQDTLSSLGELAKLGWDSLWNIGSFFDRKSDELHVAASQTKEDVVTFWRSPGEWMYNQFTKMKDGVEDWLKSSVFCQKWKGTPHMEDSVCEQPLETFGCIGCNDVTNAFCAAAGVFASELLMVFTTAGVVNTASVGARIGLKLGAEAAVKVSAKIAQTAPKMMRLAPKAADAAASTSKISRAAKVTSEAVIDGSKVIVRVGSEKIAEAKALIAKYKDGLMETRAVQVAIKVAEVTSTPMMFFDRAAEKGIIASERLLGRTLPGTYGRYMRRRNVIRELPPDPDNPSTHRMQFAMRHQARGVRKLATYENKNHGHRSHRAGDNPIEIERRNQRDMRERDLRERRPQSAEEARRHREESERREREQRVAAQERTREQERRNAEAERRHSQEHGAQDHAENKNDSRTPGLGSALVAGDVALKSFDFESDPFIAREFDNLKEEAQIGEVETAPIESKEAALKTLGSDGRSVSEQEAMDRYRDLSRTYAEQNRNNYINEAMAATGVSADVAGQYFDRRKGEIEQAGKVLFPKRTAAQEKQRETLSELKAQLASLDQDMDQLEEMTEDEERLADRRARAEDEASDDDSDPSEWAAANRSSGRGADELAQTFRRSGGGDGFSAVRAGVSSNGTPAGITALLGEVQDGNRWSSLAGEPISAPEEKVLEGLINVNALHFIEGAPIEMNEIEDEFELGLDNTISHGKIRSGQGEFLFIRSSNNIFIFKRKGSDWIKINSPHLDRLLKTKRVANL